MVARYVFGVLLAVSCRYVGPAIEVAARRRIYLIRISLGGGIIEAGDEFHVARLVRCAD